MCSDEVFVAQRVSTSFPVKNENKGQTGTQNPNSNDEPGDNFHHQSQARN